MLIESKSIKTVFATALGDLKAKSARSSSDVTRAVFDNVRIVLESLLSEIHYAEQQNLNQEEFMEKLANELVRQIVSIEDIEQRRRTSELEIKIREIIDGLKPGQAALMTEKIKAGHLSTKLSQMKHDKKVTDKIRVMQRKDKVYLVKES